MEVEEVEGRVTVPAKLPLDMIDEIAARLELQCDRAVLWDTFGGSEPARRRPAGWAVAPSERTTAVQRSRAYAVARHGSAAQWDDYCNNTLDRLTTADLCADRRLAQRLITGAAQGVHTDRLRRALAFFDTHGNVDDALGRQKLCMLPQVHEDGAHCDKYCPTGDSTSVYYKRDAAVIKWLIKEFRSAATATFVALYASLRQQADPGAFDAHRAFFVAAYNAHQPAPWAATQCLSFYNVLPLVALAADNPVALASALCSFEPTPYDTKRRWGERMDCRTLDECCLRFGSLATARVMAGVAQSRFADYLESATRPLRFSDAWRALRLQGTMWLSLIAPADGIVEWLKEQGVATYVRADVGGLRAQDDRDTLLVSLRRHLTCADPPNPAPAAT